VSDASARCRQAGTAHCPVARRRALLLRRNAQSIGRRQPLSPQKIHCLPPIHKLEGDLFVMGEHAGRPILGVNASGVGFLGGPAGEELEDQARTPTRTADQMRLGLRRAAYQARDARALYICARRPAASEHGDRRGRNTKRGLPRHPRMLWGWDARGNVTGGCYRQESSARTSSSRRRRLRGPCPLLRLGRYPTKKAQSRCVKSEFRSAGPAVLSSAHETRHLYESCSHGHRRLPRRNSPPSDCPTGTCSCSSI
jgi:hypothetical protein